jgi:hypothetical protein
MSIFAFWMLLRTMLSMESTWSRLHPPAHRRARERGEENPYTELYVWALKVWFARNTCLFRRGRETWERRDGGRVREVIDGAVKAERPGQERGSHAPHEPMVCARGRMGEMIDGGRGSRETRAREGQPCTPRAHGVCERAYGRDDRRRAWKQRDQGG